MPGAAQPHVGTAARPSRRAKLGGAIGQSETSPDWVLRDVSFAIEPGETVAVVGHTGAGKTTLISLLLRFYDVQKGAVRIDGVDVKEMDLADLRSRFGVVLQDPFLFTGTIGGNIRLGTERIRDEHVEQAAEDVNLADFVRALPNGFNEEVRERGSTLSTGQKQLISFARALAHEPKILILDEATSSVDTETEFKVRDALSRMVEGRTSLIIAHRLSTIQRADKIIVMHKGQVREMGTHQELLAQRGIYYKLYQLQYKDQEVGVHIQMGRGRPRPRTGTDTSNPRSAREWTTSLACDCSSPELYNASLRILISAGEASGEMYGAQLIEALFRAASTKSMGRTAPGCPTEQSSATAASQNPAELRSGGRPRTAVPTQANPLTFFGVGGDRMRAAGCDTVVDSQRSRRRRHHRNSQPSAEDPRALPSADPRSRPPQARPRHRHRLSGVQLAGRAADEEARHSYGLLRRAAVLGMAAGTRAPAARLHR